VGSRDGKFKIWKVPNEWRQKWVDKAEQEYEMKRRDTLRMTMASKWGAQNFPLTWLRLFLDWDRVKKI